MVAPVLARDTFHEVTLLGDPNRPCGVTLAFTERTGGVSTGYWSSLNLGDACGDEASCVEENRRRALKALGAGDLYDQLVNPVQVHGDEVVVVGAGGLRPDAARSAVREGCDAVVCTQKDVPVLLCYADCVPVILVAPQGFAVVHSGWKGTFARIVQKAARVLMDQAACAPEDILAYVGPHVGVDDYVVSGDLAERFESEFGPEVVAEGCRLDLGLAIVQTLHGMGICDDRIACVAESTASTTSRFFSYRASGGECGRHGALAIMR